MIVAAPSLSLGRIPGRGAPPIPFAPTDLPELELWLDAEEGVINTVSNNFTDETRTITVSNSPNRYPSLLNPSDIIDGKRSWYGEFAEYFEDGVENKLSIVKYNLAINRWEFRTTFRDVFGGSEETLQTTSTSDADYPWNATWQSPYGVIPTATTLDTPATNDQSVTRWRNKVSSKPHLNQTTLSSQPIFKSDVFGRKAVFFNGDALHSSGFSTFGQEYSYYLVATSLLGSTTSAVHSAIRLGTSTTTSLFRGVFGAYATSTNYAENCIGTMNGNSTQVGSFLSRDVNNSSAVFSARYNLSNNGEYAFSRNLITEGPYEAVLNSTAASQSTILIGAASTSGATRPINSNFSEVLVYRAYHDEATALQVINYLVQKWNIDTNL